MCLSYRQLNCKKNETLGQSVTCHGQDDKCEDDSLEQKEVNLDSCPLVLDVDVQDQSPVLLVKRFVFKELSVFPGNDYKNKDHEGSVYNLQATLASIYCNNYYVSQRY